MFIDTHSHLFLGELANHIPEAIAHLREQGFSHSIQIGTGLETSQKAIKLAHEYDIIRATVGVHPCEAQDLPIEEIPKQIEALERMIEENFLTKNQEPKTKNSVVGFGEIGFDHYHLSKEQTEAELQKSRQVAWFHAQIKLALKYDLPVVIHTRNCADITLEEIKKSGLKKFVIHCFSENWDFAKKVLEYSSDSMISFTAIVTYPQATQVHEVAKNAPLDRIMIETDAPFLIPEKLKGTMKYCEPAYSKYVYEKLCELRPETAEKIESQLWNNSVRFFGLNN